jgi:hypothetical protein
MRPVRVSMEGASMSLPLRMAAVGTGPSVGITIWVVSDGRYEPQNFPFFHIEDKELVWDFAKSASNYTTLRSQKEAALGGRGWEIESSIDVNEDLIRGAILSGGSNTVGGLPPGAASEASLDYLAVPPVDGGVGESADDVRNDDLSALFTGLPGPNVRVTRVRSDIAHAAMTTDLVFQASKDQSELSNFRVVTQSEGLTCPIYDNCAVVGSGTLAQSQASAQGHGGCAASAESKRGPASTLVGTSIAAAIAFLRGARVRRRRAKRA